MKPTLLLLLVILLASCGNDSAYTIHGTFTEAQDVEYIWLQKLFSDSMEVDSARIVEGEFSFHGEIDFPGLYALAYPPQV